jgi:hypothetical protein
LLAEVAKTFLNLGFPPSRLAEFFRFIPLNFDVALNGIMVAEIVEIFFVHS